jgi:hypothetical protein
MDHHSGDVGEQIDLWPVSSLEGASHRPTVFAASLRIVTKTSLWLLEAVLADIADFGISEVVNLGDHLQRAARTRGRRPRRRLKLYILRS